VTLGFVFAIFSYGAIGVITSGTWALILTPVAAVAGVIPPALQGIMSRRVAANAQGELQGALTSATALAMILSPLMMTASFAEFTHSGTGFYLPGAPFLLAMGLSILALAIFMQSRRPGTIT
jgi:DHA1 family tetracycline resistance protein-like MFS transporter